MPTRNYKDIYTLEAEFPEEKVAAFAAALRQLRDEFEKVQKLVSGQNAITTLNRAFSQKKVTQINRYSEAMRKLGDRILGVGVDAIDSVEEVRKLATEIGNLAGLKVQPEIDIRGSQNAGVSGGTRSQDRTAEEADRTADSLRRLSRARIEAFNTATNLGKALENEGSTLLNLRTRLQDLTNSEGQAQRGTERITDATERLNVALRENVSLRNKGTDRARAALILKEQQARDRLRLSVESTVSAFERENGIFNNGRQVRRDLITFLRQTGVQGEEVNGILNERLQVLRQLDRAERTAASNRRALVNEEKALATQRATASVNRAFRDGDIEARDVAGAIRFVTRALDGFTGSASEAAAQSQRLTQQFAAQQTQARAVAQGVNRQRLQQEVEITRELTQQLQTTGLINTQNVNLRSIVTRVTKEIQKGTIARKDGLRAIQQEIALERERSKLPTDDRGGVSEFAQLTLLAIVTSQIEQGVRTVVDSFAEFEQQLTEVRKTANATTTQMKALGQELLVLGQEVPIPAQELAQIAGVLGQVGALDATGLDASGFAESAREAVRLVSEIAIATDLSAEQAAKSFGQLRAIFSKDVERIRQQLTLVTGEIANTTDSMRAIFGVLNEVSNATVATVGDLQQFIQNFGGVASAAGVAIEEVAALGGAIRDLGISPQVAGTALSRLFQEASRKAEVFAEVMGTTTAEWVSLFESDANEAIVSFLERLGDLGATQQSNVLSSLAAQQRLRNTIIKLAQATEQQADGQRSLRDRLRETTDLAKSYSSVADEAGKFSETWNASINRLQNAITSVGNALQPLLRIVATFIDGVAGVTTFLTNIPGIGPLITSLAAVGVVIVALRLKFLLIQKTLAITNISFKELAASLGLSTAATGKATGAVAAYTTAINANTGSISGNIAALKGLTTATVAAGAAAAKAKIGIAGIIGGAGLLTSVGGSAVGGGFGDFLSGLGNTALTLSIIGPLLKSISGPLTGLISKFAAAGGVLSKFSGVLASLKGLGIAGLAAGLAKLGAIAGGVAAGLIGLSAATLSVKDAFTGGSESATLFANAVSEVAKGNAGFVDTIIGKFTLAADAVARFGEFTTESLSELLQKVPGVTQGFADIAASIVNPLNALRAFRNGYTEFAEDVRAANVELTESFGAVNSAVPAFLESLGFNPQVVKARIELISAGFITVESTLSSSREELEKFNANILKTAPVIRKLIEEITRQEGAEEANRRIRAAAKGDFEDLKELAQEFNVDISSVAGALGQASTVAGRIASRIEEGKSKSKLLVAQAERYEAVLESIAQKERTAASPDAIVSIAEGEDLSKNNALLLTRSKIEEGIAEQLEKQVATREAINKELRGLQRGLQSAQNRANDAAQAAVDFPALAEKFRLEQKTAENDAAALNGRINQLRNELVALDRGVSSLQATGAAALANLEEERVRRNVESAREELERRVKLFEEGEELLRDLRRETRDANLEFEDETARKIYDINRELADDLKRLEAAKLEDREQIANIEIALEERRRAKLLKIAEEFLNNKIEARQKALDKEEKLLEKEEKALLKVFDTAIKEARANVKDLEKAITAAAKASEKFEAGFSRLLKQLDDPFENLSRGVRDTADAARDLVANAARTGDLTRISDALQLGAEAIRDAAFEAGKELADIARERTRINEEAAQLSPADQRGLIEFRDAFIKNLEDESISDVERGRRSVVLRDRAQEVLGDGGGKLANDLADILENEQLLQATRDQTVLQESLVNISRQQLEAFQGLGASLRSAVAAGPASGLQDRVNAVIAPEQLEQEKKLTEELKKLNENILKLETQREAVSQPLASSDLTPDEAAARAAAISARQAAIDDRQRQLSEQTERIRADFKNASVSLETFDTALKNATDRLAPLIGENISTSDIAKAASETGAIGAVRDQATENRQLAVAQTVKDASLATKQADEARTGLLTAQNSLLETMVDKFDKQAEQDRDLAKRMKQTEDRLQRAEALAQKGN